MTQGRAVYTMQFDHYEEVPKTIAETIISKRRVKLFASAAEPRPPHDPAGGTAVGRTG